jgi:hypothetical protein
MVDSLSFLIIKYHPVNRQKKVLIILIILLIPCVRRMIWITTNSSILSVDVVILLATGAISGLLIHQIFSIIRK